VSQNIENAVLFIFYNPIPTFINDFKFHAKEGGDADSFNRFDLKNIDKSRFWSLTKKASLLENLGTSAVNLGYLIGMRKKTA